MIMLEGSLVVLWVIQAPLKPGHLLYMLTFSHEGLLWKESHIASSSSNHNLQNTHLNMFRDYTITEIIHKAITIWILYTYIHIITYILNKHIIIKVYITGINNETLVYQ